MQCRRCGKDLENSARCNFCGYYNEEGNVRELSSIEKNFYDGVTIETGETEKQNSSSENSYSRKKNYNYSTYSRSTIYTSSESSFFSRLLGKLFRGLINNNRIAKIAVTLIVVALSALMFFIALPILFLMLAAGLALFAFSRLGR